MKGLNPRLSHEYGKGWVFSVEVDAESVPQAKTICDGFPEGYFNIEVTKWSEKRSLQANAYFHVLCNLIAKETKSSMEETKKQLVFQYGTLARGKDGKLAGAILPPNTNPEDFYPYCKWYGKADNGFDMYLFFKRTHELNKEEMSRLITGTQDEAKALGIETMPPAELERMLNRWASKKDATSAVE